MRSVGLFAVAVVAVLVLSAAMPAMADINLLKNGDFETGLFNPWVTGGQASQITVAEQDSNHYALIFVFQAEAWIYQNIDPPQCAQYLNFRYFGGWDVTPGFSGDMEVRIFYSNLEYDTKDLAISDTWTPVHIELETAKLVAKVEVWISAFAGGINVDDFDLEACPEEAAPVGGVVIPVTAIAVLAPWLAIVGLVGVSTVVVVAKKRHS